MHLKGIAMAPHPPLLIPEVGNGRQLLAEKTLRGLRDIGLKAAEIKPEIIVIITPHGNVFQDGISVIYETKITGDLAEFGAPKVCMEKECDMGLLEEMNRRFAQSECHTLFLNQKTAEEYALERKLDHGSLVPLYYLDKYHTHYKIVHITIGHLSHFELFRTGRVLREAIEAYGKSTLLLASADLSHCLSETPEEKENPAGKIFDEAILKGIEKQDYFSILTMPPAIYEPAAQCGLLPIVMALGATDSIKTKAQVFSYEAPYGVGYMNAFVHFDLDAADPINESLVTRYEQAMVKQHQERLVAEDAYLGLARITIDTWAQDNRKMNVDNYLKALKDTKAQAALATEQAGVFVSIYKAGELRGCMGTTYPVTENLAQEIVRNAIEACAYDPRFLAVEPQELYQLEIAVDILGAPEYVNGVADLDPKEYGIIVEKGLSRGLLLPDLPGIETPEAQLQIAKEKAGIVEYEGDDERLVLQRFKVERHKTEVTFSK